jgi:hypothetical protein
MVGVTFSTETWRRYLALLLDGLCVNGLPKLPTPPPAFATLDDVIAVSKS